MNTQLTPLLNRWYAAFVFSLAVLLLAGCVTQPVKQAKVESYSYRVVVQDILEGVCYRGNSPKTFPRKFEQKYKKETPASGTEGIWIVDLKERPMIVRCTWLAADGAPREESANLSELLLPPYFKWDFEDVTAAREQPLPYGPEVRVELRDKTFKVTTRGMVHYYGERLPDGSVRLPYRIVTHTLYERTGQESK